MRGVDEISSKKEIKLKTWSENIYYDFHEAKNREIEASIRCYLNFNYRETNALELTNDEEIGDGTKRFLLFFLGEKEDDVKVEEADEVDLFKISLHLDLGDSVFITRKRKTVKYPSSKIYSRESEEKWAP